MQAGAWLVVAGNQANERPERPMRVGIIDDHDLTRDGIAVQVGAAGYTIGASTRTVAALVAAEELTTKSDLIVLDLDLRDGTDVGSNIHVLTDADYQRIVILTTNYVHGPLNIAMRLGVTALVAKNDGGKELVSALEAVRTNNGRFLSPYMARVIAASATLRSGVRLTPVLEDVLRLYASGLPAKEVAADLNLTVGTVNGYLREIKDRYRAIYPDLAQGVGSAGDRFTRRKLQKLAELDGLLDPPRRDGHAREP